MKDFKFSRVVTEMNLILPIEEWKLIDFDSGPFLRFGKFRENYLYVDLDDGTIWGIPLSEDLGSMFFVNRTIIKFDQCAAVILNWENDFIDIQEIFEIDDDNRLSQGQFWVILVEEIMNGLL